MKTSEAIKHYGTQTAVARACGLDPSTVCTWGEYPPPLRQLQLQTLTNNVLRAEPNCFEQKKRAASSERSAAKFNQDDADRILRPCARVRRDGPSNPREER